MLRCLLTEEQGGVLQTLDAETFGVMSKISFFEVRGDCGGVAKAVLLEVELRHPALRDGQVSLRTVGSTCACVGDSAEQKPCMLAPSTDGRTVSAVCA